MNANERSRRVSWTVRAVVLALLGAVVLAVLAYLQWRAQRNCVIPLVCLTKSKSFGVTPCRELGCGPDPWFFAGPAIALGIGALAAGGLLLRRTRRETAAQ